MQKSGQARHDKAVCETWRYIYPYFAADTGGIRLEKTLQFIQVTQQIFCPFVVNHSVLSKLYPPGGAVEQADAQLMF